ncbi:DJ-1/PfpI family protein [Tateyamaria sp.]|uniref:DJ-1/PfpI family protein n=1 Tax=Tateyamaria sp. TaxID=1929288 RepID=UPI003B215360
MSGQKPKRVGFVLYPGNTLLDFAGATQVFASWATQGGWEPVWLGPAAASKFDAVDPAGAMPDPDWAVEFVPQDGGKPASIWTSENSSVIPQQAFCDPNGAPRDDLDLDIIYVPGAGGAAVAAAMNDRRYMDFLGQFAGVSGPWVGAVCTGTFIIAAAGLLKGAKATTHWRLVPALPDLVEKGWIGAVPDGFPRSCIDTDHKRFSGGGVSSSIDLALALMTQYDRGLETANWSGLIGDGVANKRYVRSM